MAIVLATAIPPMISASTTMTTTALPMSCELPPARAASSGLAIACRFGLARRMARRTVAVRDPGLSTSATVVASPVRWASVWAALSCSDAPASSKNVPDW